MTDDFGFGGERSFIWVRRSHSAAARILIERELMAKTKSTAIVMAAEALAGCRRSTTGVSRGATGRFALMSPKKRPTRG